MSHKLILVKDNTPTDISGYVGNLQWSSNIDSLAVECQFEYISSADTPYFNTVSIGLGDQLMLQDAAGVTLHRFIVVKQDRTDRFKFTYNCFDFAWYLNSNSATIQFNSVTASAAIEQLLNRFNVKHSVTAISTSIKKIYNGDSLSDIIKDILEQATNETGRKYFMEMRLDTIYITPYDGLLIAPTGQIAENTAPFPLVNAISNPSRSVSIEDMKNRVTVTSASDKSLKVLQTVQDDKSIAQFGLLAHVESVDKKEEAKARNIARNKLAELNKTTEDISIDLLGSDELRAGRLIDVNEPIIGIVGRYVITQASHTEANGIHKTTIRLGVT
jgi:predicted  nucleic acid-binding Zn-ribbon protein